MKSILLKTLLVINLFFIVKSKAQVHTTPTISETFSSYNYSKIRSISYDNLIPSLRGESFVTVRDEENGGIRKLLYKINRSFDLNNDTFLFTAISNDGRKIIYFKNTASENEETKNITYYVDGKFIKGYDTEEFINCNKNTEKCGLFYDNRTAIFDYEKSTATLIAYKKGVDDKEKYLLKNYIFNKNDTIYVIDRRKKITLFDLNNNKIISTKINFDSIYPQIKDFERVNSSITYYNGANKYINDFENSSNNEKFSKTISRFSNLKYIQLNDRNIYKLHKIEISGYLDHNGKFEIEKLNCDSIFNKKQIEDYIKNTVFKADFVPKEVDKYYFEHFWGGYRSFDDKIAEQETLNDKERQKQEFNKRLKLERIDGIYIPENLYDCMLELDKTLDFEMKNKLKGAKDSFDFNDHMGGLGMWIRNKWGINGGSRLLKYFNDRGGIGNREYGRDIISGIIISTYIKWVNGDKNSWKEWEKQNPIK